MNIKHKWPRYIGGLLIIVLLIVFLFRKKIIEHPLTQKKMELMESILHNEPDSAKQIIKEVVDSSFYLK